MLQARPRRSGAGRAAFSAQCSCGPRGSGGVPARRRQRRQAVLAPAPAPAAAAPAAAAAPRRQLAEELWARGVAEYVEGQQRGLPAEGLRAFEASLKADPEHSDRLFFAATLHSVLGHEEEAERGYNAAIAAAPAGANAYMELVMFLEAKGRRDDARAVARRAILAGAQWANEWQRPPIFTHGLASHPWWDRSHFPWASDLEAAYPTIKAEMDALLRAKGSRRKQGKDMPTGWTKVGDGGRAAHAGDSEIVSPGGDWREFLLVCSEDHGPPDPDIERYLPQTMHLLETLLPGAVQMAKLGVGEIIFSALAPGTRLAPHCASSNVRLTCHLGMVCPEGARMRVGPDWGTWQEGKCTFFDDSYEHEIVHSGNSTRIVLLIRFWHPDLPQSKWMSTLNTGVVEYDAMSQRRVMPPMNETVVRKVQEKMPQMGALMGALGYAAGGGCGVPAPG